MSETDVDNDIYSDNKDDDDGCDDDEHDWWWLSMMLYFVQKDPYHALKELAKMCILADCTLMLAFT